MKLIVKTAKPRNPFVAASLRRVRAPTNRATVRAASRPSAPCGRKYSA